MESDKNVEKKSYHVNLEQCVQHTYRPKYIFVQMFLSQHSFLTKINECEAR